MGFFRKRSSEPASPDPPHLKKRESVSGVTTRAQINKPDEDGDTALHIAALRGDAIPLAYMCTLGGDVNAQNKKGATPLILACAKRSSECIVAILTTAKGAVELDVRDSRNCFTALMVATVAVFPEGVKLLLDAGADPNVGDKDGDTALHLCVAMTSKQSKDAALEISKLLLGKGANFSAENQKGVSPLQVCPPEFREAFQDLLKLHMLRELAGALGIEADSDTESEKEGTIQGKHTACFCGSGMEWQTGSSTAVCDVCISSVSGSKVLKCKNYRGPAHTGGLDVCEDCVKKHKGGACGVHVTVRDSVSAEKETRFGWGSATKEMVGTVVKIEPEDKKVRVQFPTISTAWAADVSELESFPFSPNLRVQVKEDVKTPKFKWGSVSHSMVGVAKGVDGRGVVAIDFGDADSQWHGVWPELDVHPGEGVLQVGDEIKVRKEVKEPRYKWGGIDSTMTGVLKRIDADGDVFVDYPESSSIWRGIVGEVERVEASSVQQDASGVELTVSSGNGKGNLLSSARNVYWESNGSEHTSRIGPHTNHRKGTHWVMLKLPCPYSELTSFDMLLRKTTVSYLPEDIEVWVGLDLDSLTKISSTRIRTFDWTALCPSTSVPSKFQFIQLRITKCHDEGINCRIHGLRLTAEGPTGHQAPMELLVPSFAKKWRAEKYDSNHTDKPKSSPGQASTDLRPGITVAGQYELVRELGTGGFGSTWLAKDSRVFHGEVVLKFLLTQTRDLVTMFEKEARKLDCLDHPQIPKLKAYFEDRELSRHVLVMDVVRGCDLDKVVKEKGPMPAEEVLATVKDLLRVLEVVHSKQIIHRDIKAENVMIEDTTNKLMLIDFGAGAALATDMSVAKTTIGTPGYIAPEVVMGRASFESDYYSLGALALYLVTGTHPAIILQQEHSFDTRIGALRAEGGPQGSLARVIVRLVEHDVKRRKTYIKQIFKELLGERDVTDMPLTSTNYNSALFVTPATDNPNMPSAGSSMPKPVTPRARVDSASSHEQMQSPLKGAESIPSSATSMQTNIPRALKPEDIGDFKTFNNKNVIWWLHEVGLEPLAQNMWDSCVDGEALLELTPEDMEEIGITTSFKQKRLIKKRDEWLSSHPAE